MSFILYVGDCLKEMERVPSGSVDMILCDLPYGTTACAWDTVLPFAELWAHYNRAIKPGGAIVLTAAQPFTSALVMSNPKAFKYNWIWEKNRPTGFANAKKRPLKIFEDILVFNAKVYNPQGLVKIERDMKNSISKTQTGGHIGLFNNKDYTQENTNYPKNILKYSSDEAIKYHPTQKPVELFKYLISTYTNEGDTVMDNCIGSGTTAVACRELGRNCIGMERETEYVRITCDRNPEAVIIVDGEVVTREIFDLIY